MPGDFLPTYKATFFINSLTSQPGGWSESFYLEASTPQIASKAAEDLAPLRSAALGEGMALIAWRVSDVALRGDALVTYGSDAALPVIDGHPADSPWQGFLYRLTSGNVYRSMHIFRGVPDDSTNADEKEHLAEKKILDKFVAGLIAKNWRMRSHLRGAEVPPLKIIAGTADTVTHRVTFTSQGAHGLTEGDTVRISGVKNAGPDMAGVYQVLTTATASAFGIAKEGDLTDFLYLSGGTAQKVAIGYPILDGGFYVRVTHKKVGRPFGLTRGRAPVR